MIYDDLQVRLEQIRQRMAEAAHRVGRSPEDIVFLAAAKTVPPQIIHHGIQLGIEHIGENRVQEAEGKFAAIAELRQAATWHLIGHLQTNKVRRAIQLFDVIQTVDSIRLAQQLERVAQQLAQTVPIYIEVNVGGEISKTGIAPDQLLALAETVSHCPHLRLDGLMAVPPYGDDPQASRPYFKQLRMLRDALNQQQLFNYRVNGLSMGMSHDFEVAIEEGATLVRIGTALWGPRPIIKGVQ